MSLSISTTITISSEEASGILQDIFLSSFSEPAAAVEAMGADLALGKADGGDKVFYLGEFEGRETKTTAYLLHQSLVFRSAGGGVFVEVAVGTAL